MEPVFGGRLSAWHPGGQQPGRRQAGHGAARRLGIVSNAGSPIVVEGPLWGAIIVVSTDEPLPLGLEGRLEKFTELLATAIANAESRSELAASRRRIVAASDQARRRIERDLSTGRPPGRVVPHRGGIGRRGGGTAGVLARDPPGDHFDARAAPGSAHARPPFPGTVDLDVTTNARFLEPIEIAVHYVASEALANAMKHAQASRIEISLTTRRDSLLLSIRDDGIGGPMPRAGADLTDDPPDQAP